MRACELGAIRTKRESPRAGAQEPEICGKRSSRTVVVTGGAFQHGFFVWRDCPLAGAGCYALLANAAGFICC